MHSSKWYKKFCYTTFEAKSVILMAFTKGKFDVSPILEDDLFQPTTQNFANGIATFFGHPRKVLLILTFYDTDLF